MSYYLYDPHFYLSTSSSQNPTTSRKPFSEISYADYSSNRMARKGQLIEEESMLRRLKAVSAMDKVHRQQEISAMRIKYQLQELDEMRQKKQQSIVKVSPETQLIRQQNRMDFAVIEGCRNTKKINAVSKGHAFPSYVTSVRK